MHADPTNVAKFTDSPSKNVALFIDGRGVNADIVALAKREFFRFLPSDCHFFFVLGTHDQQRVGESLFEDSGICLKFTNIEAMNEEMKPSHAFRLNDIRDYSTLLLHADFWNFFVKRGYEYCLILQHDVNMFRYFPMNDFHCFRYIGAPWPLPETPEHEVYRVTASNIGNGGCSFRHMPSMIRYITKFLHTGLYLRAMSSFGKAVRETCRQKGSSRWHILEDVFFAWANFIDTNVEPFCMPTRNQAFQFALESVWPEAGVGINDSTYTPIFGHQLPIFFENQFRLWSRFTTMPYFYVFDYGPQIHRSGFNQITQRFAREFLSSPEGCILFLGYADVDIINQKGYLDRPWVGIFHTNRLPPTEKIWNSLMSLIQIKMHPNIVSVMQNCRGIFALSKSHRDEINETLKEIEMEHNTIFNIPIDVIYFPNADPSTKRLFDKNRFKKNPRIVQIGQQYRRLTSIFRVRVPDSFHKIILEYPHPHYNMIMDQEISANPLSQTDRRSVQTLPFLDHDAYDDLLSTSVIFLDLISASSNNTVTECMLNETPLVVNRVPSVEEYLGSEYPLFYDALNDVYNLLSDPSIFEKASLYMKNLKYSENFTHDKLIRNIMDSFITRGLYGFPMDIY